MFGWIFLLAAQGAVAEDRQQFEELWVQIAPTIKKSEISKKLAWHLYEWNQVQYSLGFCSQYYTADVADKLRYFPNEREIMNSTLGRELIASGHESFVKGTDARKDVKPTPRLCAKEMAGRLETLEALSHEASDDPEQAK